MAVTYTIANVTNDPNTGLGNVNPAIDTGVGTAPAARVAVFTPVSSAWAPSTPGYVAPTSVGPANQGVAGNDWSMNTTPVVRPKTFEPPTYSATIDLGLAVNG